MRTIRHLTKSNTRRIGLAAALAASLSLSLAAPVGAQAPTRTPDPDNGAVILMYHRFGEDSLPSTSVRLAQFEAHLAELTSGGYEVLALPEIVDRLRSGSALPERAVAITIDDAALSVYSEAWPRLKALNLPFTLFVSTEPLDLGLAGYMNWAQLREIAADPLVTVGHHGHAHAHMAWLDPAAQRADIAKASERFTAELGGVPELFAYPYGEVSLALRQTVAEAGFAAAFGQHSGAAGEFADSFVLPRFPLNEAYGDMERFGLVTSALPLPVEDITPADLSIARPGDNPPNFGFTVAAPVDNLAGLSCFASSGEAELTQLDQRIELRFAGALPAGRVRVNCTLPGPAGRWRWFGTQFVVSRDAQP